MAKFRKKPVVIEAWRNSGPVPDWVSGEATCMPEGRILIHTLEGNMIAEEGDWIIKGMAGELYPCKPAIFEATYEGVEASDGE